MSFTVSWVSTWYLRSSKFFLNLPSSEVTQDSNFDLKKSVPEFLSIDWVNQTTTCQMSHRYSSSIGRFIGLTLSSKWNIAAKILSIFLQYSVAVICQPKKKEFINLYMSKNALITSSPVCYPMREAIDRYNQLSHSGWQERHRKYLQSSGRNLVNLLTSLMVINPDVSLSNASCIRCAWLRSMCSRAHLSEANVESSLSVFVTIS